MSEFFTRPFRSSSRRRPRRHQRLPHGFRRRSVVTSSSVGKAFDTAAVAPKCGNSDAPRIVTPSTRRLRTEWKIVVFFKNLPRRVCFSKDFLSAKRRRLITKFENEHSGTLQPQSFKTATMSGQDLYQAAKRGDAVEVERLIKHNADVNFNVCSAMVGDVVSVNRCRYVTHLLRSLLCVEWRAALVGVLQRA